MRVVLFFLFAPVTACLLSMKFVVIPAAASHSLALWAEGQNMDLTVDRWSADLLSLTATAHDIELNTSDRYTTPEFLSADALEIDLSPWSGLLKGRWIREIRITDPTLHIERLSSGRWNWADLGRLDFESIQKGLEGGGDVSARGGKSVVVPRLVLDGMSFRWVEHLPANSGAGVIQELTASLFVDDIFLTADDIRGWVDLRPEPSRLGFEARTGSGRIEFDGQANLFNWSDAPGSVVQDGQIVHAAFNQPRWAPTMRARIYLENVEAAAFARLTPNAAIVTDRGSLGGTLEVALQDGELTCIANLNLRDVSFRVNPTSPLVNARTRSIEQDLADYRASGQYQFACGGLVGTDRFRPMHALQTNIVQQGVRSSTVRVRAVAAMDHSRYSEEPIDPELQREVNAIQSTIPQEVLDWIGLGIAIHREVGPPSGLPGPGRDIGDLLGQPFGRR